MHIRLSSTIGLHVLEEGTDEFLGIVSGALIHPDTGKIEGFFLSVPHFLHSREQFFATVDIVRWGTRVYLRDADAISPLEDRIRLQSLLQDPRTVIGQKMVTESDVFVGRCRDVQFSTKKMKIEWLFPRKFWRWGVALPLTEVVEIQPDKIVLRDPVKTEKAPEASSVDVQELAETALSRPSTCESKQ